MISEVERPVAVIAGGGSGIGRGCALRLAGMGYHVVLVGWTAAKLDETAEEINNTGGSATAFQADVRDWDQLGELQALVGDRGVDPDTRQSPPFRWGRIARTPKASSATLSEACAAARCI